MNWLYVSVLIKTKLLSVSISVCTLKQLPSDGIIRKGMNPLFCTLITIIGKRFKDSGLRDLAVDAGVVSEGSID